MKTQWRGAAMAGVIVMAVPQAADGQTADMRLYNIPAQDLGAALKSFATTSGREIVAASADLADKRSGAAIGTLAPEQAVAKVLAGTGLSFRIVDGAFVIRSASTVDEAQSTSHDIVVTGSRIRGSPSASPMITIGRDALQNSGQAGLGGVIRELPQNFGGGQNPGLGINVPASSGVDVGGGSSINLRGLGSDATLTLLDGRRLAFSASRQAIDVSAIPLNAIDRLEIVPDGASAIYGSDAVAGVANIILKRRAEGLRVGTRISAASDGGDFQQRYWATGGLNWSGGSVVGSYDYGSNSAIVGAQRSYAEAQPGLTLYPAMHHHSATLAGEQVITPGLTFDLDAIFNIRWTRTTFPTVPSGDIDLGRATTASRDRSWVIAPSVTLALPQNWEVVLAGDIGGDRVDSNQTACAVTICSQSASGFYSNSERSLELSSDGPLVALPGGDVKAAAGFGYRAIGFERFAVNGTGVNAIHDQDSNYAFGELDLPLIGHGQHVPLVDQLTATAALRDEHYPGVGGVATPKVGLIWAPTPAVEVKGSWGRSFKAATQYQQYAPRAGVIYPAASLGGTGAPAGAGVLYYQGGNPALKPERASTWSASLIVHPRSLRGASFELSYFKVDYYDRIVSPIAFVSQALSDPLYTAQVVRNPSTADQAAIVSSLATLFNITGAPYDPATIVAIVDNANVNAGRQTAQGVDMLARYGVSLGGGQRLNIDANASYLNSTQQLTSLQPATPLAGRIFSPPHWRGRGALSWTADPLTIATAVNYTGGVIDARRAEPLAVAGMTTVDLTARINLSRAANALRDVVVDLAVDDLFNAKPAVIAISAVTDTPYDSTNYAPFGRVISVGLSKRF